MQQPSINHTHTSCYCNTYAHFKYINVKFRMIDDQFHMIDHKSRMIDNQFHIR